MSAAIIDRDQILEALAKARAPSPEVQPAESESAELSEPPEVELPPPEAYEDEPHLVEGSIALEDFHAYMPMHSYIFRPTRELWSSASVNSRIPQIRIGKEKIRANAWLDQHRHVEQMTWAPGFPEVIEGKLVDNGGWIERQGIAVYNLYRPPQILNGDPTEAGPWLAHVHRVFPGEAEHIIRWLAQRAQRPDEKINHALVLGGAVGIGKDSILEPVTHAVGPWNCQEVSPVQLMGRFNGFLKAVILRVSEARDQGDAGGGKIDRYAVHEHCKTLLAAPPAVLRIDQKNVNEYSIMNVCGVVFTTNHSDGLYLPPDDRRHFVAWSELEKDDFSANYWPDLYDWYDREGGNGHVAAYLRSLDISTFDAKAPPPKTSGFWRMVDAGRAPEDGELADALEQLGDRAVVTITEVRAYSTDGLRDWLGDRRNSRQISHRMEAVGYVAVRNEAAKDGLWKPEGRRQVVYAKRDLPLRERLLAAAALCRRAGR